MTNIKVRNGTTPSIRLCDSCSYSHIFQGEGTQDWVRCKAVYGDTFMIPVRVVRCSKYYSTTDSRRPSLEDMKEQAYILTEDGPMKRVGFVKPVDWRKRNKNEEVIPGGAPDLD